MKEIFFTFLWPKTRTSSSENVKKRLLVLWRKLQFVVFVILNQYVVHNSKRAFCYYSPLSRERENQPVDSGYVTDTCKLMWFVTNRCFFKRVFQLLCVFPIRSQELVTVKKLRDCSAVTLWFYPSTQLQKVSVNLSFRRLRCLVLRSVLSVFIDLRCAECVCSYCGLRVCSQTNK